MLATLHSVRRLAVAAGFLCLAPPLAAASPATQPERTLFVWAGDVFRQAPDFLAVVDFDEGSPTYGRVVGRVDLPAPGESGNEPHHVGLSADGRVLALGGLLSILKGQPEIFFFDVKHPRAPRFLGSADPPHASITDEFYAIPGGGFLVTMMGGPAGASPGRVVEFGPNLDLVAEHPAAPPAEGFNPHGISVRPERNLMVTSDFVCPSTTLHAAHHELTFRGSVRVWNLRQRTIVRTVLLPTPSGSIDVQLIPGDRRERAFTAGMTDDKLYLIDTRKGTAKAVFDFGTINSGGWPQLFRLSRDGKRLFITMHMAGKVAMLDISDPNRPQLLDVLDLGAGSGPHYLALTADEKRLVISDYFLDEDEAGVVHAEGDHRIHVAKVSRRGLTLDSRFELDFDTAFPTGPARPHGLAMK
jgi:56kDa selenium binding protein (SBP56)